MQLAIRYKTKAAETRESRMNQNTQIHRGAPTPKDSSNCDSHPPHRNKEQSKLQKPDLHHCPSTKQSPVARSSTICRARDLRTLDPKRDVSIKSLPLALRELFRGGGRKNAIAKGMENTRETRSSEYSRTDARMRLWLHARDRHRPVSG